MPFLKRGSRAWQLLALAVIAVPWFLRDHLATTLETQLQETQEILHGLDNERERQLAEHEQRDTLQRMERMEILLRKIAYKSSEEESATEQLEAYQQAVRAEGQSMQAAVETFQGLLSAAAPTQETKAKGDGAAAAAAGAAQKLSEQFGKGTEDEDQTLLDAFDGAARQLDDAFEALYKEADARAAHTEEQATLARFVAWVLTGLGALMMGGGAGLFGKPEGDTATP